MEVKLLSGALGAEIKGIDLKDTSDKNFNKIGTTWGETIVLHLHKM